MKSSIAALLVAMAIAAFATPAVRVLALRVGAVDQPGGRHVHAGQVPRLGGIALVVAFFASLGVLLALDSSLARLLFRDPTRVAGLAGGGVMLVVLGAFDDLRGVRAWHKLGVQVLAAALVFFAGFQIDAISLPGMGQLQMGVFALPVTVLWIVTVVNAMNLIDGLDGLAAGIAFFAAMTNFVVSLIHHDVLVMLLSAALAGAVLGFLLYNFNPATIFMGDSGSMFLGFVLATTALLGHSVKSSTTIAILAPLIALGVPIMDTLLTIVRRYLERRPIFSPDRGHIHHRLLDLGLTQRRAVVSLYGLSVLFCVVAIVVALGSSWEIGAALIFCVVAIVGMVRLGGFTRRRVPPLALRLADPMLRASTRLLPRLDAACDVMEVREALREFCEESGLTGLILRTADGAEESLYQRGLPSSQQGADVRLLHDGWPGADGGAFPILCFSAPAGSVGEEEDAVLRLLVDAVCRRGALAGFGTDHGQDTQRRSGGPEEREAGARSPAGLAADDEPGQGDEPAVPALAGRKTGRRAGVG